MREKIAQWIHANERAVLKVTYKASPYNAPWDELPSSWKDGYRAKADQILALIRAEIGKSRLTEEELKMLPKYVDGTDDPDKQFLDTIR